MQPRKVSNFANAFAEVEAQATLIFHSLIHLKAGLVFIGTRYKADA